MTQQLEAFTRAPSAANAEVFATAELITREFNIGLDGVDAAFADGALRVPETLADVRRDVKAGSGPDASNKLYS